MNAQLLREHTTLAEDLSLVFQHPYQVAHNHLQVQLHGIWCPLLAPMGTLTHSHTHR